MAGFIAVYRWRVAAEHESAFRKLWREVTMLGRENGAYGSCLTRDANGELVAIALWPSEEARAAAFKAIGETAPWPPAERLAETKLDVVDDLWTVSPFHAIETDS